MILVAKTHETARMGECVPKRKKRDFKKRRWGKSKEGYDMRG